MKRQIRNNVFETNSSSIHTLVYKEQVLEKSELKVHSNGEVRIYLRYFGRECLDYDTQEEKMSYIMSYLWCFLGEDNNSFENYYLWKEIKDALIKYINNNNTSKYKCTNITFYGEGDFDHQTYPECLEDCVVDLYNPEAVVQFVFNKNAVLHTDSD